MKRPEHLISRPTPISGSPAETPGFFPRILQRGTVIPLIAVFTAASLAGAPAAPKASAAKAAAVEKAAQAEKDAIDPAVLARGKGADKKKYPDADNVLLFEKERYVYDPSGNWRTFCESYAKILTEKGREELRTLSFYFNTT